MGVGLNDNNAILNSVDVVVEVGVELGNIKGDVSGSYGDLLFSPSHW